MRFGFICEGKSDIAVLENILNGLFDEDSIEINELHPPRINYSLPKYQRNDRQGGWERLKDHLATSEFKTEVLVHDYVIIQIDSDEASHVNFNVQNNITMKSDHSDFIQRIENRLIDWINLSSHLNYSNYKDKIIFCITVHSIECWVLAHLNHKSKYIINCEDKLITFLKSKSIKDFTKDYQFYRFLTKKLESDESEIKALSDRSQSFKIFLEKILFIRNSFLYSDYIFIGYFNNKLYIKNKI